MKRNLLFAIVLMLFLTNYSFAEVAVEQTTDAEYLINTGYSQAFAEDVFISKNRVNGRPIEALYEASDNKVSNRWRKFFSYLDPAQDTYDRIHHDIQLKPSFSDL